MSSGYPQVEIGIFGGSGLYALLDAYEEVIVETPYGEPSDAFMVGTLNGKSVAFLPRHGRNHTIAPHKINYRANLWAMQALGATGIIAPSAVGSLQADIHPGSMVVCDQFVDRTTGRKDTFFDDDRVVHVSPADPYCPILREHAIKAATHAGVPVHRSGTLVVINGPRFSTKAESQWFTNNGWHVIGMTGYPEAMLARELAWLRLHSRRLLWLNPLLRFDGYEPVARGAAVLHRHAHGMLAVHNLGTLEQLAAGLAAVMKH